MIPTVVGIMGLSVSCLQTVFRHLQSTKPWLSDPDVVELPWRNEKEINDEQRKSVTFGIFSTDGITTPHPPIQRALRMVESALRALKFEVCSIEESWPIASLT